MSTTLTAPEAMNRREQVADLLDGLDGKPVAQLFISFSAESLPTTSYLDELIRQTLAEGAAQRVTLLHADEYTAELATAAAVRYGVTDRLTVL